MSHFFIAGSRSSTFLKRQRVLVAARSHKVIGTNQTLWWNLFWDVTDFCCVGAAGRNRGAISLIYDCQERVIYTFFFLTLIVSKLCMLLFFTLSWLNPNKLKMSSAFQHRPWSLFCPPIHGTKLLQSACGDPNQQWEVRKRAASSGSLLVGWRVECPVACVLWVCLCLSGYSCGHSSAVSTSFMHSIMAMCSCHKTSWM